MAWPPRAVTMRVLDLDGREVHSKFQGQGRHSELASSVVRGTVRGFLSPKAQWMAASRKDRPFADGVDPRCRPGFHERRSDRFDARRRIGGRRLALGRERLCELAGEWRK